MPLTTVNNIPKLESRRTKVRTRLIQATVGLIHQKGFEALSVKEIADRAGISVGGLYRHIKTKSDLLVMACEDIFEGLKQRIIDGVNSEPTHAEKLKKGLKIYSRACLERSSLIRVTYREYLTLPPPSRIRFKDQESEIAEVFHEIISAGISAGVFVPVDTHILAFEMIFLAHMRALKNWALYEYDEQTIVNEHAALFLSRLLSPSS